MVVEKVKMLPDMLLSFAGKALKPGADTKSAFGEFFEEESKRPSVNVRNTKTRQLNGSYSMHS